MNNYLDQLEKINSNNNNNNSGISNLQAPTRSKNDNLNGASAILPSSDYQGGVLRLKDIARNMAATAAHSKGGRTAEQ